MNTSLAAPAAALCAALFLLLVLCFFIRTPPPSVEHKFPLPSPVPSDVEKGEALSPAPFSSQDQLVSDVKASIVDDVWPRHELASPDETPAPTLGSSLPDVALVWGVDYSFPQPSMSDVDRRPLMAYSRIASALGVDEPEPPVRTRSASETLSSSSLGSPTDTRPMRSRSLISGIVSDWNSLSQSEQQAWATLSEARASRTQSGNSRHHGSNSPRAFS